MSTRCFCLCMIVKNESRIIQRCFDSIEPWVAEWVIHDTGSTDGTQEIIRDYWASKNIPGRLVETEWQSFGENRTQAVNDAANGNHYILLGDADYQFRIDEEFKPKDLVDAAYYVVQSGGIVYRNIKIIEPKRAWRYVGRTHEYIEPVIRDAGYRERLAQGIEILEHYDGANRADKFERDLVLLHRDLEENSNNPRTLFYLGQTNYDLHRWADALPYYEKTAECSNWEEEISHALCRVGEIRARLGYPFEQFAGAFLASYRADPGRLEAMYRLTREARERKDFTFGFHMGIPHLFTEFPTDKRLFLDPSIWAWRFPEEIALCAFYSGRKAIAKEIWERLLRENRVPPSELGRVQENLAY